MDGARRLGRVAKLLSLVGLGAGALIIATVIAMHPGGKCSSPSLAPKTLPLDLPTLPPACEPSPQAPNPRPWAS